MHDSTRSGYLTILQNCTVERWSEGETKFSTLLQSIAKCRTLGMLYYLAGRTNLDWEASGLGREAGTATIYVVEDT
jgi:hypothetical protein